MSTFWDLAIAGIERGLKTDFLYEIDTHIDVRLMPFHYFIASKLGAHNSRNKGDLRQSKDFEDIVYSFDNRLDPLRDLQMATGGVMQYLQSQMNLLFEDFNFHEGLYSHLNSQNASARTERIRRIRLAYLVE
jgi:hypothetical protein